MAKYLFVMANEGHRWGGSELLWSAAAERLASGGSEVRVSTMDWHEPVPQIDKLRRQGCRIFYRDYSIPPFFTRQIRRLFPAHDYRQKHVREAGENVDLVIVSQGSNDDGLLWIEAAREAGYRYTILSHSAVVYWWPADDLADRLAKAYDKASAAYFVSQANLELSQRQFGSMLRNAKVVRNPFNVRYDAAVAWPAGATDDLALAFVGRLDIISKGLDLLLQVLARPQWRERRVRVSLFGHGPHERALRRMATEWKLDDVSFKGESGDIEKVWIEHHALILPSRFEGMPLVVVEAMLCGRPCITTNVGGNAEVIRDGVNGFLAKAATADSVDEALNRAWEHRDRLQEMGEVARRDVRKWVSPDPAGDFARELESQVRSVSKG